MGASGESAQGAGSHGGIEVGRSTNKGELIQTLVLTIRAISSRDLLDITYG